MPPLGCDGQGRPLLYATHLLQQLCQVQHTLLGPKLPDIAAARAAVVCECSCWWRAVTTRRKIVLLLGRLLLPQPVRHRP